MLAQPAMSDLTRCLPLRRDVHRTPGEVDARRGPRRSAAATRSWQRRDPPCGARAERLSSGLAALAHQGTPMLDASAADIYVIAPTPFRPDGRIDVTDNPSCVMLKHADWPRLE